VNINALKSKIKQLKNEINVLKIAYIDKRTPLYAKLLIGLTVGYLLSPIDLIPDFIPILGLLDDLIIVPFLISISIKVIPTIILHDARLKYKSEQKTITQKNWITGILIIILWGIILWKVYQMIKNKI
jgi:uncharacterized membrane protein YkvA (DUF1232 family)